MFAPGRIATPLSHPGHRVIYTVGRYCFARRYAVRCGSVCLSVCPSALKASGTMPGQVCSLCHCTSYFLVSHFGDKRNVAKGPVSRPRPRYIRKRHKSEDLLQRRACPAPAIRTLPPPPVMVCPYNTRTKGAVTLPLGVGSHDNSTATLPVLVNLNTPLKSRRHPET